MPVPDAFKNCRLKGPEIANAGGNSKLEAPVVPDPPGNSRIMVPAATEVLNPWDFVPI